LKSAKRGSFQLSVHLQALKTRCKIDIIVVYATNTRTLVVKVTVTGSPEGPTKPGLLIVVSIYEWGLHCCRLVLN